jgi:hypothetical protein
VDAGTPSTYLRIKKRDCYLQVLENLTRYAHAGSQGGGRLALKYIFCNENCSDDDISGFAYAMLAIRPHQVWLTFDFSALASKQADTEDLGDYDFAKDIAAYARMYHVLKKHGVHAVHYTVGHLARVSVQGKILLERVLKEIEATEPHGPFPDLRLENFRESERNEPADQATFHISPLRLERPNGEGTRWSLENKRVLLAPACSQSIALASDPEIRKGRLLGFLDRDRTVQGKSINGLKVHGYGSITDLAPDAILVAAPGQHESEIVRTINRHTGRHMQVAVLGRVGSL